MTSKQRTKTILADSGNYRLAKTSICYVTRPKSPQTSSCSSVFRYLLRYLLMYCFCPINLGPSLDWCPKSHHHLQSKSRDCARPTTTKARVYTTALENIISSMFSTPPVKKRTHTRAFSRSRTATPTHGDSPPEASRARSPNNSSLLSHTLSKRLADGTPASLRRSSRRRGTSPAVGDDMLSMSGVVSNVSSLDGFRRDNDPSLLAKDDRIAAAFSGRLPDEVREKLVNADGYREPIFAYIDKSISYAVVALPSAAYVWSVKRVGFVYCHKLLTYYLSGQHQLHQLA